MEGYSIQKETKRTILIPQNMHDHQSVHLFLWRKQNKNYDDQFMETERPKKPISFPTKKMAALFMVLCGGLSPTQSKGDRHDHISGCTNPCRIRTRDGRRRHHHHGNYHVVLYRASNK
jgi:hypothetical protein